MEHEEQLLETLRVQEDSLQFEEFTSDTALQLGLRLIDAARRRGKAIVADIRRNGQLLFHHAMTGTAIDNAEWIRRKCNVVQRYGHSSYYMGTYYRLRGTSFEVRTQLDPQEYAAHGGAFPLIVRRVGMVGTVAVSGLPQAEDHELVTSTIAAFLAEQGSLRA